MRRLAFAISLLGLCAASGLALAARPGSAQTTIIEVDAAYLKDHSHEMTLSLVRRRDNLGQYQIKRTLKTPKYVETNFTLRQGGEVVASNSSTTFVGKGENRFDLAVHPKQLENVDYQLAECDFDGTPDNPKMRRNWVIYKIHLKDAAPLYTFRESIR